MGKVGLKTQARLGILIWVVVLCSSLVRAQDYGSRVRNAEADRAYQQLAHANIFNFGGVGWGLTITPEEKAFHTLLNSENSINLFKRLLSEANPEGQLYALYGLYVEDRDAFKVEAQRLQRYDGPPARWEKFIFIEKGKVRTGAGCLLLEENRQSVMAKISNGDFDRAFNSSHPGLKY